MSRTLDVTIRTALYAAKQGMEGLGSTAPPIAVSGCAVAWTLDQALQSYSTDGAVRWAIIQLILRRERLDGWLTAGGDTHRDAGMAHASRLLPDALKKQLLASLESKADANNGSAALPVASPLCFISHDSIDKPIARAIAFFLKSRGIRVWFDEYAIVPDQAGWAQHIERGL